MTGRACSTYSVQQALFFVRIFMAAKDILHSVYVQILADIIVENNRLC